MLFITMMLGWFPGHCYAVARVFCVVTMGVKMQRLMQRKLLFQNDFNYLIFQYF